MHICADEIMAFMMLLPGVAAAWSWVKARYRNLRKSSTPANDSPDA